jgi:hypothetical protein
MLSAPSEAVWLTTKISWPQASAQSSIQDSSRSAPDGRDRDVVAAVTEREDGAVVDDDAAFLEEEAVAQPAGLDVRDAHRVEPLEERARVGTGDEELAERPHVDQADTLAHGAVLAHDVAAVGLDPLPRSGPQLRRAEGLVDAAQARVALDVVPGAGGRLLERQRPHRRPEGGRDADAFALGRGDALGDGPQLVCAQPPLARAHRDRRCSA